MKSLQDQPRESAWSEEARIRSVYEKRRAEFRYSWFNEAHVFILQRLESKMLALLRECGYSSLAGKSILEIGCGSGYWLREFIKWGTDPHNVVGVDILEEYLARARQLCPGSVRIDCANACKMVFPDSSFDLVIQCTVFTSVLDPKLKQDIASEMLRVVKKEGYIIWYDFHVNNPWNPAVRGVNRKEIYRLFPECSIELKRVTLAPPLVRFLVRYSYMACYVLEQCRIFNTHYVGLIRKS